MRVSPTAKGIISLWFLLVATVCVAETLAQYVKHYDWASFLLAGLAGLAGGAGRTLITQLSGKSLVRITFILLIKDLIVALAAGFGVFLGIEAYNYVATNMKVLTISEGLRVYALIVAGYSRWGWLTTLDQMTADAIARFRKFIQGNLIKLCTWLIRVGFDIIDINLTDAPDLCSLLKGIISIFWRMNCFRVIQKRT